MCISSAVCYFRAHDCDIFAASGESTAWMLLWKTRSRPICVRICPVAQHDFFSTAFDPREWTMVVVWKEDSGRQLRLITPENQGGDETSSSSPPRFTFFNDPDFPLGPPDTPSAPPVPPGPPDSPGLPDSGRGRARAENVSRERSRPRSQSPGPQLKPNQMSDDDDDDQSPQDGDSGNGQDCVIEYILTHKRHKHHRYHQFNPWLLQLNQMKILAAPEDNVLHLPMRSQQPRKDKVA